MYNKSMDDFDYLGAGEVYLDSACQSLRPRAVIEAVNNYYTTHNSCGERVKYKWGIETDEKVEAARDEMLKYLKLPKKKYNTSFTLNTTYGINLVLAQIKGGEFKKIMTSEIEHNSPFLASIAFAKKHQLPREVMQRNTDGTIPLEKYDFEKAVVVVNSASNFDGRKLLNAKELVRRVHQAGGIVIIDAAQTLAHSVEVVRGVEADAIATSAHKMYGPSLGVLVWRDDLLAHLEPQWLGGGMVDDVFADDFQLSADNKEHRYTRFEAGLQAWGEIVGFEAGLKWLEKVPKSAWREFEKNYTELFNFLGSSDKVHLVNAEPNPTMSFYVEGVDSHLLGTALSRENIMARTGYFCAHYYLDHVLGLPPLVRFSLGLHNRSEDIEKVEKTLSKLLK